MSEVFTLETMIDIKDALAQTSQMVGISLFWAIMGGIPLGLILYLTSSLYFNPSKVAYNISSLIVSIIRSIPFVILLVLLLPLTRLITGSTIGSLAASVPLSVASIAFIARLAENSFQNVEKGVIEAALASGAGNLSIIKDVLVTEALPSLVNDITVTAISLIGYSAMAGIVGGGGIGDLAIRFGYYRYQTGVMLLTVFILVVLVQLIQWFGDLLVRKLSHK
ncbi:methionine ABC transporter permease [Spirochaeta cellobiosiphila]|uniref:methionine ABC transporter permease n=1 Tax=Spirochaeta cellobiosiphila TaxID=504483 RepID=UPI0004079F7A|nr:methionine ABC transporter permease [Spirochaeta cellobiosiphila]